MEWEEAIEQAKENLGLDGYLNDDDWDEVVEEAKIILSEEYSFYRKKEYKDYMKSGKWQVKRYQRLFLDSFKCQDCIKNKNIDSQAVEVHHITYERFKNEKMEDLISLCKKCHELRHKVVQK